MANDVLITKVPDNLKKLVRLTARSFYQPLQIVCLDILTKYPCVTLMDLVEVLKMHGSQKQLQQALNILHKDKLVKWLQKMEVQGDKGDGERKPAPKMMHYYYINYKQFVNVVKYKLDQMRKKMESDDKMAQNRTSYTCSNCNSSFSDLDISRLFDPADGNLRCSHCRNILEEEQHQANTVDSRKLISQLNEYVKPITDLLRETENLNLAPEILEPEAQGIQKYLLSSGIGRRISSSGKEPSTWTTRSTTNLYGESTAISVNIGDSAQLASKVVTKERPEWMVKSTVHSFDDQADVSPEATPSESLQPKHRRKDVSDTDRQILEDLMAHEAKHSASIPSLAASSSSMPSYLQERAQYSSSSSGEEDMEAERMSGPSTSVSWMGAGGGSGFDDVEEFDDESSEDEGYAVKVGEKVVPVNEVTDEMVASMTSEEKERYTIICQKAWSQADDYI